MCFFLHLSHSHVLTSIYDNHQLADRFHSVRDTKLFLIIIYEYIHSYMVSKMPVSIYIPRTKQCFSCLVSN